MENFGLVEIEIEVENNFLKDVVVKIFLNGEIIGLYYINSVCLVFWEYYC